MEIIFNNCLVYLGGNTTSCNEPIPLFGIGLTYAGRYKYELEKPIDMYWSW